MIASVYTDQRSSVTRDVLVQFEAEGIRLVDAFGVIIAFWSYADLNILEDKQGQEKQDKGKFRIGHKRFVEAFLTSEDPSMLRHLKSLPEFSKSSAVDYQSFFRVVVLLIAGFVCYTLSSKASQFLASPISQMLSIEQEAAVAGKLTKLVTENISVCVSHTGTQSMEKIVARISPALGLPYNTKITVLDDPRIHGFAIGAGEVLVYRGLLQAANNESEFVPLVVHELAHTADRHPIAAMLRSLGMGFFLRVYAEGQSPIRFAPQKIEDRLGDIAYSKAEEQKAFALSAVYLGSAGLPDYRAEGFAARVNSQLGKRSSSYFSHAHNFEVGTETNANSAVKAEPILSQSEWAALQNICSDVLPLSER